MSEFEKIFGAEPKNPIDKAVYLANRAGWNAAVEACAKRAESNGVLFQRAVVDTAELRTMKAEP